MNIIEKIEKLIEENLRNPGLTSTEKKSVDIRAKMAKDTEERTKKDEAFQKKVNDPNEDLGSNNAPEAPAENLIHHGALEALGESTHIPTGLLRK